MANLTESKKRDFISQLIVLLTQNVQLLTDKGYNPETVLARLQQELVTANDYEAKQREALAAAKDATQRANSALNEAYTDASAVVDLISGLLGKKDNLLLEIKKIRNSGQSHKKASDNEPV